MTALAPGQGALFVLVLVAVVVARFLLRELRVRKIPLSRIFVMPAIAFALGAFLIALTLGQDPAQLFSLIVGSAAAILVGIGVGLAVAHFTSVRRDITPGVVLVRGSYITVAIWIGALMLRMIPRLLLAAEPHTQGLTLMLNAVLFVMLATAIFVVRFAIFQRSKALG